MSEKRYFRHFKGGLYELIGLGTHSETGEEMVLYKSLKDGRIWIRPREMFFGNVNRDGYIGPRFTEIAKEDLP